MNDMVTKTSKYLIAGGLVVAINLGVLYSLTEFLHVYYLVSSVCSFGVAFCCSFLLQKFWTFRDTSTERVTSQLIYYLLLQLGNVCLNTLLLYVIVEFFHLWYISAQILVSLVLAAFTFVIVSQYIFVPQNNLAV